jgi:protein-tyrosine phosphatase
MNPKLYWIDGPWPGKLAISARPRGGDWLEDEISGWRKSGVDAVVSLLTPQENDDLQLAGESNLAQAHGLRFVSLAVEDRGVPRSWEDASRVVANAGEMLRQGRNVAVHCRQGIGRSGMIAAALLIKDGSTLDDALKLISDVRGLPVPETTEQREWVRKFAAREPTSAAPLTRTSMK